MPHTNGRFAEQDAYILTGQVQTSNNNQGTLNAALAEANHLRGSSIASSSQAITRDIGTPYPSVSITTQNTIGAALGNVGQAGTASQQPGGGGIPCPYVMDYALINCGIPTPVQVRFIEVGMELWNPFTRTFEAINEAEDVEDQELWQVGIGKHHTLAIGSQYHPLIRDEHDQKGTYLKDSNGRTVPFIRFGHTYLNVPEGQIYTVRPLGRRGTVRRFETVGPTHIYAAGSDPTVMLPWHNLKPLNDDDGGRA